MSAIVVFGGQVSGGEQMSDIFFGRFLREQCGQFLRSPLQTMDAPSGLLQRCRLAPRIGKQTDDGLTNCLCGTSTDQQQRYFFSREKNDVDADK